MDFKKILVGYDGSKDSASAVQIATDLAARFKSVLVVVHVYSSPMVAYSGAAGLPAPDLTDLEEAAKDGGQKLLDRGMALAKKQGVTVRGELLEAASVVQALVEFASNEKADLLVVGTRGMTGFKKLLLGSVSNGLVTHASCPVLVVRGKP